MDQQDPSSNDSAPPVDVGSSTEQQPPAVDSSLNQHKTTDDGAHRETGWKLIGAIVIVIVVGAIAALLVRFVLPVNYRQVGWGTLAFVAGSALSLATEPWKTRKCLKWLRPVFVPIILAGGGLLTTQGWNTVSKYRQDQALLVAAASEWKWNDMQNVDIVGVFKSMRDAKYKTHQLFDLPTNRELSRAVDITMLNPSTLDRFPLGAAIRDYVTSIDFLCVRLSVANEGGLTEENLARVIDGTFGRGDAYPKYLERHRIVGKMFRERCPGLLEQVDWIKPQFGDRMKERRGQAKDPNDKKQR